MMARTKHRILSILLTAALIMGMLPVTALAADETPAEGEKEEIVVEIPVDGETA